MTLSLVEMELNLFWEEMDHIKINFDKLKYAIASKLSVPEIIINFLFSDIWLVSVYNGIVCIGNIKK